MRKLTPKYRKRLQVLWAIEAVMIAYNVCAPSFETMVVPMAGCWLYVMACAVRESFGFETTFSQRNPYGFREWKAGRGKAGRGVCPVPGDADLCARWEELRSVSGFAWQVFAGFIVLFFALLGRGLLVGPYE